jgi:ribosomal protein L7/L12
MDATTAALIAALVRAEEEIRALKESLADAAHESNLLAAHLNSEILDNEDERARNRDLTTDLEDARRHLKDADLQIAQANKRIGQLEAALAGGYDAELPPRDQCEKYLAHKGKGWVSSNKIYAIKVVRQLADLGLYDAKRLVEDWLAFAA